MRRGTIVVLGLLLASSVLPHTAQARPKGLGAVLGVITNPIGKILGTARHGGPSASRSRRHYVARHRFAAPTAAAAAGIAAVAAAPDSPPKPDATEQVTAAANTKTAPPADKNTGASTAAETTAAARTDFAKANSTAPETAAEPRRSAVLAAPADQPRARAEPAAAPARPAHQPPQLGVIGPPAWPTAFEDIVGYALWPKDYGERLRAHGIGDVLATAFTPSSDLLARSRSSKSTKADEVNAGAATVCGNPPALTNWPAAEIERTLTLDATQRARLDEFKVSFNDAVKSIRATCRDEAVPVDRLRAMQNTLWAVHDAAQLIRGPLGRFHDSLSAEQQRQFAGPVVDADPRNTSRNDLMRMCGTPNGHDLPVKQMEQTLRTTKPQRASLDSLQKKTFEMAQFLMASCLKPMPTTPAERLDAAADRLTAVIFAASNVNTAINDFTSLLDPEQKTQLISIGR
jgi:LTXXQ motif family protein